MNINGNKFSETEKNFNINSLKQKYSKRKYLFYISNQVKQSWVVTRLLLQ